MLRILIICEFVYLLLTGNLNNMEQDKNTNQGQAQRSLPYTPLTEGEIRVRTKFNPDNQDVVQQLKEAGANFINMINAINPDPAITNTSFVKEFYRWKAMAMTSVEEGTRNAVQMATFKLEHCIKDDSNG